MTSNEKGKLLSMLKTLICQHEGPVQIKDEAIALWEKHTGEDFYDWEKAYAAMVTSEKLRKAA
jgi:hypothetical protein